MAGEKLMEYLGSVIHRDGWTNIITGLGLKSRDKKKHTKMTLECMTYEELEEIYANDDMSQKIIDVPAEDMMTKGHKITLGEDQDAAVKVNEALIERKKSLNLDEKFTEAIKMGDLYGDAFLLLGIDDGQEASEPLDVSKIKEIKWVHVMTRHDLQYRKIGTDPQSPFFRKPETYQLCASSLIQNGVDDRSLGSNGLITIHASRMIHFIGQKLPYNLYRRNGYRNFSKLQKAIDPIISYNSSHASAATFLEEFSQGIFKIKDLGKLLASGNDAQIMKRLELVDMKRSVVKSIVIDADGEDFSREVPNLGGVPQIIEKMEKRMVAASGMPHTRLLGEGATGSLGGGGESENKDWYDSVARMQRDYLKPRLIMLYKILFAESSGAFRGSEPKLWDIEFNSLWEMSDAQKADIRLKTAQTDKEYIVNQVLTPDEVAMSRFGSGKFSMDTALIFDREKTIEEEENDLQNREEPSNREGEEEDPAKEEA